MVFVNRTIFGANQKRQHKPATWLDKSSFALHPSVSVRQFLGRAMIFIPLSDQFDVIRTLNSQRYHFDFDCHISYIHFVARLSVVSCINFNYSRCTRIHSFRFPHHYIIAIPSFQFPILGVRTFWYLSCAP